MKISVIIPVYNEEKNLPKIIGSLRKQTSKNFEIIVVDNNSTDDTFKIAKKLADEVYKCFEQGISPARNYGAKKAKSEIVAFLDADTIVPKNWIKSIENAFKKDISAVHGFGVYDHKNPFKNFILNLFTFIVFYSSFILNLLGKPSVIGNNMAIKKDIFEKVKGFDKVVVEDYYLSLKLRKLKNVKCKSERKMKIIYSSRRIEKAGLLKTLIMWGNALYKRTSIKTYKLHDKI